MYQIMVSQKIPLVLHLLVELRYCYYLKTFIYLRKKFL